MRERRAVLAAGSVVAFLASSIAWANSLSTAMPGMAGSEYKLTASLDPGVGGAAWVESQRPLGATHDTASFLFDPSGIEMRPDGAAVRFMGLIAADVHGIRVGAFGDGNSGGWTGAMAFDEFKSSC